jgi:hypothetical protein
VIQTRAEPRWAGSVWQAGQSAGPKPLDDEGRATKIGRSGEKLEFYVETRLQSLDVVVILQQ